MARRRAPIGQVHAIPSECGASDARRFFCAAWRFAEVGDQGRRLLAMSTTFPAMSRRIASSSARIARRSATSSAATVGSSV